MPVVKEGDCMILWLNPAREYQIGGLTFMVAHRFLIPH